MILLFSGKNQFFLQKKIKESFFLKLVLLFEKTSHFARCVLSLALSCTTVVFLLGSKTREWKAREAVELESMFKRDRKRVRKILESIGNERKKKGIKRCFFLAKD